MKEKIYNYLVAALYGVPSCNYCQHMDCSPNRSPAADAKMAGVITSYTRTTRLMSGEWQGTL